MVGFVDYENTFDTTEEPDYPVHLESDADVGVLRSKEWFEWDDVVIPFGGHFPYFPHSIPGHKIAYRNVSVSGDIFVWNQLKVLH